MKKINTIFDFRNSSPSQANNLKHLVSPKSKNNLTNSYTYSNANTTTNTYIGIEPKKMERKANRPTVNSSTNVMENLKGSLERSFVRKTTTDIGKLPIISSSQIIQSSRSSFSKKK